MVRIPNYISFFILVAATLSTSRCSEESTEEQLNRRTLDGSASGLVGALVGQLTPPADAPEEAVADATIRLVGEETYEGKSVRNGTFRMENVAVGTYHLFATSTKPLALASTKGYGVWIQDVEVKPNQQASIGEHVVKPTGTLRGKLYSFSGEGIDLTKAEVQLLELQNPIHPKKDGSYELPNIPEGIYTLHANLDGHKPATMQSVRIAAGATANLGDIILTKDDRPAGRLVPNFSDTVEIGAQKLPLSRTRKVEVIVETDFAAEQFRLSDKKTFPGRSYEDLRGAISWEFSTDGKKMLYGQVRDADGTESKVFTLELIVDTTAPSIEALTINDGFLSTNSSLNLVRVTAGDSGSGLNYISLSRDGTFEDARNYAPEKFPVSWDFLISGTTLTVYAKAVDHAGRESATATASIGWASGPMSEVGQGTFSYPVRFSRSASPYYISGDSFFLADVLIDPGVEISIASQAVLSFQSRVVMQGTRDLGIQLMTDPAHTSPLSGDCSNLAAAKLDFSATSNLTATYTTFSHLADRHTRQGVAGIRIHQGKLSSVTFDMSTCTDAVYGTIHKYGDGKLTISHSRFRNWDTAIELHAGDVLFSSNYGDVSACLADLSNGDGTFTEFENDDFVVDMQQNPPEGCTAAN